MFCAFDLTSHIIFVCDFCKPMITTIVIALWCVSNLWLTVCSYENNTLCKSEIIYFKNLWHLWRLFALFISVLSVCIEWLACSTYSQLKSLNKLEHINTFWNWGLLTKSLKSNSCEYSKYTDKSQRLSSLSNFPPVLPITVDVPLNPSSLTFLVGIERQLTNKDAPTQRSCFSASKGHHRDRSDSGHRLSNWGPPLEWEKSSLIVLHHWAKINTFCCTAWVSQRTNAWMDESWHDHNQANRVWIFSLMVLQLKLTFADKWELPMWSKKKYTFVMLSIVCVWLTELEWKKNVLLN